MGNNEIAEVFKGKCDNLFNECKNDYSNSININNEKLDKKHHVFGWKEKLVSKLKLDKKTIHLIVIQIV